ncbi:MAG: RNA-binding protein [Candidatus Doudnabacteria bacterium]|nr:RNA-binding protein [Candidatus Doudnabacteria bacterium]
MAKKLYVGNLPWSATNDDLSQLFGQHGAVISASVLTDKMTGRSRGFGFVEMENDADADAAIAALNGQDYQGRKMVVNEARPMEDRPPRRSGGGGGFRSRGYDN